MPNVVEMGVDVIILASIYAVHVSWFNVALRGHPVYRCNVSCEGKYGIAINTNRFITESKTWPEVYISLHIRLPYMELQVGEK